LQDSSKDKPVAGEPIFILAGGGTGGHVYPGLAVADELAGLRPGAKIVFACSDRPIDRHILDPTPYAIVVQPVQPLPRSLPAAAKFVRCYLASALQARQMLADLRPSAVLGLGGFAAAPVVCRAAKCGVRTGLLNPDAVPGKANRMLARRADAIFTAFASTADQFPAAVRAKVRHVGCPVRRAFMTADRQQALDHFGLRADRKTLVVNGGSLGAASINQAVALLADELGTLGGTWQVLMITGKDKAGATLEARGGLCVRVLDYCQRMDLACAAADLSLGRAGAGTVAELGATATPAVLMPYPYHADQHQRLNAAELCQAGAAIVVDDAKTPQTNAVRLRETLLPILRDPARLDAMRQAARSVKGAHAARSVARWLLGMQDEPGPAS
jgi:UDP-N-acetylglucosamine--N-acetylmuramyl-(pentapeptide) pyrophosphoryl-undecaprenol N-acetylglucosamine transferase